MENYSVWLRTELCWRMMVFVGKCQCLINDSKEIWCLLKNVLLVFGGEQMCLVMKAVHVE